MAQNITPERLEELRQVLGKIDPAKKKTWLLELYVRRDGQDWLDKVIDIRTGKPYKRPKAEQAASKA